MSENDLNELCKINEIDKYLDYLEIVKDQCIVFMVVKDTPGSKMPDYVIDKFIKKGFSNFSKQLWKMYAGIKYGDKILLDQTNEVEEAVSANIIINNDDGAKICEAELVSKAWRKGNDCSIKINNIEYAVKKRGINLVVYDPVKQIVVDSLYYDSHDDYKNVIDRNEINFSLYLWRVSLDDNYTVIKKHDVCSAIYPYMVKRMDYGEIGLVEIDENENFYSMIGPGDISSLLKYDTMQLHEDWKIEKKGKDILQKKFFLKKLFELFSNLNLRAALPIVDGKKVVGVANLNLYFYSRHCISCYDFLNTIKYRWYLISDDVALKFFPKGCKILLSSDLYFFKDFYNRFLGIWEIDFFDESSLIKYREEYYDIVIFRSNLWFKNKTKKYEVTMLCATMIAEQNRKNFISQDVEFYYLNMDANKFNIINYNNRKVKYKLERCNNMDVVAGNENKDYYIVQNVDTEEHVSNNGIRRTLGNRKDCKNNIHFFGPCMAHGEFVRNDNDTIESWMQYYINTYSLNYNVINHGITGSWYYGTTALNMMELIRRTKFNKGDIIILMDNHLWNDIKSNDIIISDINTTDIFNKDEYKNSICFDIDDSMHLNSLGNKIVAKEIFADMLEKGLLTDGLKNMINISEIVYNIKENIISRIDIGVLDLKEKSFEIINCSDVNTVETKLKETYNNIYVKSIESLSLKLDLRLKILGSGKLIINFRGKEVKNEDGELVPYWIDYKKICINNKTLLDKTFPAWYNVPINLSGLVKEGEIVNLNIEWGPHIDNRTVIE